MRKLVGQLMCEVGDLLTQKATHILICKTLHLLMYLMMYLMMYKPVHAHTGVAHPTMCLMENFLVHDILYLLLLLLLLFVHSVM